MLDTYVLYKSTQNNLIDKLTQGLLCIEFKNYLTMSGASGTIQTYERNMVRKTFSAQC